MSKVEYFVRMLLNIVLSAADYKCIRNGGTGLWSIPTVVYEFTIIVDNKWICQDIAFDGPFIKYSLRKSIIE